MPRCAWLCVALPGCAWRCLAVLGSVWQCLAVAGCAWLCLAMPACAWLCVTMPGCAWLCPAVHGCACVRLAVLRYAWLSLVVPCSALTTQGDGTSLGVRRCERGTISYIRVAIGDGSCLLCCKRGWVCHECLFWALQRLALPGAIHPKIKMPPGCMGRHFNVRWEWTQVGSDPVSAMWDLLFCTWRYRRETGTMGGRVMVQSNHNTCCQDSSVARVRAQPNQGWMHVHTLRISRNLSSKQKHIFYRGGHALSCLVKPFSPNVWTTHFLT